MTRPLVGRIALGVLLVWCVLAVGAAPAGASPTLLGLSARSGSPGATVTVNGSAFGGASGLAATFAGVPVAVQVVNDSTLAVVVPVGAVAGVSTLAIEQNGAFLQPTFAFTVITLSPVVPGSEVGAPYAATLLAAGTPPYSYAVSGSLPSGLVLNPAGTLSGVATIAGTTRFSIVVSDAAKLTASFALSLSFVPGPSVATASLGSTTVGTSATWQLAAAGGEAPYDWSIASGGLPGGLVLGSGGLLAGRPGTLGDDVVDLRVTDAVGASASRRVGLVVARAVPHGQLLLASGSGTSERLSTRMPPSSASAAVPATVAVIESADGARSWLVTATGAVVPLGSTPSFGEVRQPLAAPVVAAAAARGGGGYVLVTATGKVYGFGTVHRRGSIAARRHPRVVGIALTRDARGYWLVTASGGVRRFGDAPSLGSVRRGARRGEIVGIAATPDGRGYWLAASSGQVYAFGAARVPHLGSALEPTTPVVAIAAAPSGGYWLVQSGGTVTAFGRARVLHGISMPGSALDGVVAATSAR